MSESKPETMSIGQAAEKTGLSIDTLRYYEREGLLPYVPRTEGGQRLYNENHLGAIRFLTRLKLTGMPITKMREYMALAMDGAPGKPKRRQLLVDHRSQVLAQIDQLQHNLKILNLKIELYEGDWEPGDWSDPRALQLKCYLEENLPDSFTETESGPTEKHTS
jgi:DNA-binding transcriptional MerR regulator